MRTKSMIALVVMLGLAAGVGCQQQRKPKAATETKVKGLNRIHFDFDRSDIKSEYRKTMDDNASWLKSNRDVKVTVEGHCDERGTEEYNMALGHRRRQFGEVLPDLDGRRRQQPAHGQLRRRAASRDLSQRELLVEEPPRRVHTLTFRDRLDIKTPGSYLGTGVFIYEDYEENDFCPPLGSHAFGCPCRADARIQRSHEDVETIKQTQDSSNKILADTVQTVNNIQVDLQAMKGALEENRHFFEQESEKNAKILKDFDLRITGMEERLSLFESQLQDVMSHGGKGGTAATGDEAEAYRKALAEVNAQNYKAAIPSSTNF
jgi:hypothetical protein